LGADQLGCDHFVGPRLAEPLKTTADRVAGRRRLGGTGAEIEGVEAQPGADLEAVIGRPLRSVVARRAAEESERAGLGRPRPGRETGEDPLHRLGVARLDWPGLAQRGRPPVVGI
jgi:hypothetical protein